MAKEDPIEGIDIQAEILINHAQALALFLRGEADLLCAGTSQGWENRLDGSPIQMIGTGIWGISSLIGTDPAIRSFADLRGKRLALPFPGSPLDFQTRAILAREGINPDKDLQISYGAFTQSVPRILAGQLDAAAIPEPLATVAVRTNGLARLVEYADAWEKWSGGERESPQVSLFATESFARAHKELLASLVEAWRAASARIAEKPGDFAPQFSAALSTDAAILEEAARHTIFAVVALGQNKERVLKYYRDVSKYFPGSARPLDEGFFFIP